MPSFSVFRVPSAVSDYVEVWKLRRKWPFLTVSDALAVLAVSGGQISWRYH
jgi:hypothetical protein